MEELLANIERAIAARPGFQNTAVFDEPTAAWGRSTTRPQPTAIWTPETGMLALVQTYPA